MAGSSERLLSTERERPGFQGGGGSPAVSYRIPLSVVQLVIIITPPLSAALTGSGEEGELGVDG